MADDDMCLAALATKSKPKNDSKSDSKPLASLATKSMGKFDDDTPLSALGKPKPAQKAPPPKAGAPGKAGVAPRKSLPGQKRKAGDSSSSSSSSSGSDSSSSSDSDKPLKKGKPKKKAAKAKPSKPAKAAEDEGSDGDNEDNKIVKKKDRTKKEEVVAELLCRWWYALPDWPPTDQEYYTEALKKANLRKVTVEEWEWVDETEFGLRKVYELTQYRGVFRNSSGDLLDLRPRDTCPCYSNLMRWDLPQLYNTLVKAYEEQLKDLDNSKYEESELRDSLKKDLTKVRNKAGQAAQLTGPARMGGGPVKRL